ncbi:MAG: hypothetical protein KF803_03460 [Cyclobacteriaceae bacterium]|nr:hypothetical protein [Cyclobacteriaceae bacterium]
MTKNFFYFMHTVLLALVFLGFAPSFYFKPLIADQPFYPNGLPTPHIIHGVILTVWYIFLVVQARWIKVKAISTHRKSGWFGAVGAVLVIASTVWVISLFPDRMEALAQQTHSTVEELEPNLLQILWLDIFMSTLFVVFVLTGILKRNTPHIHKRLMLYTGIVYLFAATFRLGGIIGNLTIPVLGLATSVGLLLGLTVSLLVHDYRTYKKIYPVSWICFVLYWGFTALSFFVAETEIGRELVDLLQK